MRQHHAEEVLLDHVFLRQYMFKNRMRHLDKRKETQIVNIIKQMTMHLPLYDQRGQWVYLDQVIKFKRTKHLMRT